MKIRRLRNRAIALQFFGIRRYIRWMHSYDGHQIRGSVVTPEEAKSMMTGEIGQIEGFRFYVS